MCQAKRQLYIKSYPFEISYRDFIIIQHVHVNRILGAESIIYSISRHQNHDQISVTCLQPNL